MRTLFISNDKCKKCYGKGYVTVVQPMGRNISGETLHQRTLYPCICLRPVDDAGIEAIHQEMLKRKDSICSSQNSLKPKELS